MYQELVQKALLVNHESRNIEFKREFDPKSRPAWCEVVKDIVAIANTGGGIIVFGLENDGTPSHADISALAAYDPADISNKVTSFTGTVDIGIEVLSLAKENVPLVGFLIASSSFPVVFEKPGTYEPGNPAKGISFAQGTIYYRHGAKSEPARGSDLHSFVQRVLRAERKGWISKVRKVTTAPAGSRIIAIPGSASSAITSIAKTSFRAVNDPKAPSILLTRDVSKATSEYVHEKISPQLFDEINNIVDLNRLLAAGQDRFVLSSEMYFRIYATRTLVSYSREDFRLFLRFALIDGYFPGLFWATKLPPEELGKALSELYLFPHPSHTHYLMRVSLLLGREFCEWLFSQWKQKWKNSIQKPSFYSTFQQMIRKLDSTDPIIAASRLGTTWYKSFPDQKQMKLSELLADRVLASKLLHDTCTRLYEKGSESSSRSMARDLDYIVHGSEIASMAGPVIGALKERVKDRAIANLPTETVIAET